MRILFQIGIAYFFTLRDSEPAVSKQDSLFIVSKRFFRKSIHFEGTGSDGSLTLVLFLSIAGWKGQ